MEQQRVAIDQLQNIIGEQVSLKTLLKKIVE
jgi:glycyl-tRNA synthetase